MGGRGFPLLLACMCLCAGCGFSGPQGRAPVSFSDDMGTQVKLQGPARRVVTLGPSATETVLALGGRAKLVGADSASFQDLPKAYLSALKGVPSVGQAYQSPDVEKIVRLKPGLVLAVYPGPYVTKLRSLGISVAVLDPKDLPGIEQDIRKTGLALGDANAAAAVIATFRADVQAVSSAVSAGTDRPTVFVELSPKLYTVGPGSFMDALVRRAGGVNVVDKIVHKAYPQVTAAQVLSADPQVIILQDQAAGASWTSVAARPGWSSVSAVARHRVVAIDPNLLSDPGPEVALGLKDLAGALHPGIEITGFIPIAPPAA